MAPLRTLLVGFGRIAAKLAADPLMKRWFPFATHLQYLLSSKDYELVGIVESSADARADAQRTCPWIPVAPTAGDLADLRPDVLVLAIPPNGRLEALTKLPTVRGLMLEKPIGPPSIRNPVLALCAERRIAAQVHYWRRGDPAMQSLAGSRLTERLGRPQAVFGIYGGGLHNNGSHLIDLIRMLLGPIIGVRATSSFVQLDHPSLIGDGSVNFVLELASSTQVAVQALDFRHYREVGLDIWGESGRLSIMQEGLYVANYPITDHRGLMDVREVASDQPVLLPIGSADATPNLYRNLAYAMNEGGQLISPLASALATERAIDTLMESAEAGTRVACAEPVG